MIKWIKSFYHRLASPREFYSVSRGFLPYFAIWGIGFSIIGSVLGLGFAPADYQQGDSFRIIYLHVPSAWMSLFIYMTMAISAAIGLIWRIKMATIICLCSAPIGAAFTFLALATGALWGAPTWGTWWVWDARLTSELMLLFIYLGIVTLYHAFDKSELGERAASLLAVIGVVMVPIIHYSVVWWNSLHQGSTVFTSGGPKMPASMLIPLIMVALGFSFLYGLILFLNAQSMVLWKQRRSQWVQQMFSDDTNQSG